jgi:Lytic transglycolase
VIVRVNDRGPFSDKRIIDLSSRAAEMLDYKRKGVATVNVEYVGKARMDGHDEKFLLASYRSPDSAPVTGTSDTLIAMADDVDLSYTGSAVEHQIETSLIAGTVPFPQPRPGRNEPGIALDMIFVASAHASMISSYLEETPRQQQTAAAFAGFEERGSSLQSGFLANPATRTVIVLVGTYPTGEAAGSAYETASQIGPTSFQMAFVEGREQFEILLHVGGDVASPVIDKLRSSGYLTARLLD